MDQENVSTEFQIHLFQAIEPSHASFWLSPVRMCV